MNILKSVFLLSIISIFIVSVDVSSFAKGKDIWVIDGKEMDELPDELLTELQNDPYVRETLGLENTQGQKNSSLDIDDYSNYTDENITNENIPNTVIPIKTIDATDISNVIVTGNNVGIVIEKSLTNKFELDYVGVNDTNNFTFNDTINLDNTLEITVSANSLVDYIYASSSNKVNVVNIKIPEKIYNSFSINIEKGSVYLPNIGGKVFVDSNKSSIKVEANQFESDLNLNLQKSSLKFNVTEIVNDINISGIDTGNSVNMTFNELPKNLKLDTTKCEGRVILPNGWTSNYEIGLNKPIINLNIKGSTKIIVK